MRKKITILSLLAAVVLMAAWQISPALAAHGYEDATPAVTVTPTATPAPVTGTVQSITLKTDPAGVVTVEVTLLDSAGVTQTFTLSLDEAVALGLVTLDASGAPVVNQAAIGTQISITPPGVTPPAEDNGGNPVGSAIASFFGVDPSEIATFHADGAGYGVIAQACWISYRIAGNASLCGSILDAKKAGTGSITLPDGSSVTFDNWGQFKKEFGGHGSHQNLGGIMSGHADPIITPTPGGTPGPGDVTPTPAPSDGQNQGGQGQNSSGQGFVQHPGNHGNGNNGNSHGNHGGNGKHK